MPTSIDSLQIDIIAQSNKADVAIDRLVSKLDKLSNSIGKIPTGNISSLASGVDKLGRAMQLMGNVDSRSFTRLANNINKLSQVDVASINNASSSIRRLATSFNVIGTASKNTQNVAQLASALGKLGGKSVTTAIVNLPLLTNEMNNLLNTLARSPQISRNVIDMTNALANLASRGRSVGTASKSLSNGLNGTHKSMFSARTSAFSLASAFGKLYANYFLVIRGAKAFVNAIKGTSDYIEAFNYYNVAFGKIADEWDKDWKKYGYNNAEAYADSFTERMQESLSKMSGLEVVIDADGKGLLTSTNLQNLGLNIQEITQYASQLASVTNSVGQAGEVSLAAARSFTKLGADLSSLFNIDYSDAMANLQSGLIGQSRALYKYGIDITNATLQTYAYELGLKKSVSEMTQAEKMQLRMVAILDQSKVAWGDLANTINSPSNMLRQFTNNLNEVGMVLGQLFIPLMERVMPVVNGATIAIKNFLVNIASLLGIQIDFSAFGEGFSGLGEDTADLADGLDDLTDSAKRTNKQLGKFDELNNITLPSASSNGSGLGASIDLTEEIVRATEEYEKVWNEAFENMKARANLFAEEIGKIFAPITKPFEEMLVNLKLGGWTQAGENAGEIASGLFDLLSDGIEKVNWTEVGNNIGNFLKGIEWIEVIKSGLSLTQNISDAIAELWFGSLEEAPFETTIATFLLGFSIVASPKIVLLPILTFQAGFSVGKEIGKLLFPEGKEFYEEFTWTAEGGFFETIQNTDFSTLWDAFKEMSLDIQRNPVYRFLTGTLALPKYKTIDQIKEEWQKFGEGFSLFTGKINKGVEDLKIGFVTKIGTMTASAIIKFQEFKSQASLAFSEFKESTALKLQETTNRIANFFSIEEWTFDGIKEGLKKSFESAVEAMKGVWNGFATWINDALTFEIQGISKDLGILGKLEIPSFTINLGKLPTFQTGGFPEDGLFMANRGELVGQFSNGRTAVANNEQIVAGIEGGVERAVARVLAPYLADIAESSRITANKDFGMSEDSIFGAVQTKAQEFKKTTGKSAFG